MAPQPGGQATANLRARIVDASARLPGEIAAMPPRLRAGVLIVLNHLLEVAARTWGAEVLADPASAPPSRIDAALSALGQSRDFLFEAAKWSGPDEASRRQIVATDLAILTLGYPRLPSAARPMTECWRAIWTARSSLGEAMASLRAWEAQSGVDALPRGADGIPPTDHEAILLAQRVPGLFRRRQNGTAR